MQHSGHTNAQKDPVNSIPIPKVELTFSALKIVLTALIPDISLCFKTKSIQKTI